MVSHLRYVWYFFTSFNVLVAINLLRIHVNLSRIGRGHLNNFFSQFIYCYEVIRVSNVVYLARLALVLDRNNTGNNIGNVTK